MINLKNITFDYEPFPHGICKNIIDEDIYQKLVDEFPKIEFLKKTSDKNNINKFNKYSLSSNLEKKEFFSVLNGRDILKKFINYLLSREFKKYLIEILYNNNINFGIKVEELNFKKRFKNFLYNISPNFLVKQEQEFEINVEFSSIPFKNGMIKPHTDSQYKFASIVIPIVDKNWVDNFNGGTNFLKPKNNEKTFNYLNNTLEFNETELIKIIPFERNQFLIFLKTFNSLHSVGPMTGYDENKFRNSLTLTLEKKIKI
jgi:hypothetical protein